MAYTRVLVQECKPGMVEMLTRKAEQTLVPRIRSIPGLLSYEVGKIDDHSLVAIGRFETRQGAEELERLGVEWRRDEGKDAILSVKVHFAEIILHAGPEARPRAPEARPIRCDRRPCRLGCHASLRSREGFEAGISGAAVHCVVRSSSPRAEEAAMGTS